MAVAAAGGAAGAPFDAPSPAETEPDSHAPSRTTSTRASTVPCTRAFSVRVTLRARRSPFISPAISAASAETVGLDARALAEHQAPRQRDLAPEAAVHDRVLALELPLDVRLRVDDRGLLVRHA